MVKKSKSKSKSKLGSFNNKENIESLKKNILSVSKDMNGTDIKNKIHTISNTVYIVIYVIISLIVIGINLSGLFWIDKLEKIDCKCSAHWKRDYIKYYLYCLLTLQFILLITKH
jgi:hypothetical protein